LPDYPISAGYFVLEGGILADFRDGEFERDVLPALCRRGVLYAFEHTGFWRSVDTHKDLVDLEEIARRSRQEGSGLPWAYTTIHHS
jgi:glucose-1-phosphate cytidylyltransferase